MLANFFGKSKPINFIVLLLFFVGAYFIDLFLRYPVTDFTAVFLLKKIAFLLVLTLLFALVTFIISKNKLTYDNSYALLFYLLIAVIFIPYYTNIWVILESFCYLFFLRKIYSLKRLKQYHKKLFDAGFWLGVLCIFNSFSILFFLMLFVAVVLHTRLHFKVIAIFVLGAITPIFLFYTYCFWQNQTVFFTNKWLLYTSYDFSLYGESSFLLPWFFCAVLVVVAILAKSVRVLPISNGFKKKWLLLVVHFIVASLFFVFTNQKHGSETLFLAFPVAVILANGFELLRSKIVKEIVLLGFLITVFLLGVLYR